MYVWLDVEQKLNRSKEINSTISMFPQMLPLNPFWANVSLVQPQENHKT